MKPYLKNFKTIKIYAHLRSRDDSTERIMANRTGIALGLCVLGDDGLRRIIAVGTDHGMTMDDPDSVITSVTIHSLMAEHDASNVIVDSPQDIIDVLNSVKPANQPAILLHKATDAGNDRPLFSTVVYWEPVDPKGNISVKEDNRAHRTKKVPVPEHKSWVRTGSIHTDFDYYNAQAYWTPDEIAAKIWNIKKNLADRIKKFCAAEQQQDEIELSHGKSVLEQIMKFQTKTKSLEEKINEKWNDMSTEDKAKALKITRKRKTQ